ncbi:MAG: hypothetical protein HY320_11505 [Armatimonadetes bacterium]|nr:hypothetical protein [Armatimonadota bacterium]
MGPRCRRVFLLLLCLPTGGAFPAAAQGAKPKTPLLRQLFPELTGRNGYEEFVAAADLIDNEDRAIRAASQPSAMLAQKHALLADARCAQALYLLRRGLRKPIASPRESLSPETLFPEAGAFRDLARLLQVEQYVLLADGRTRDAIQSLRDGLRFGDAIQTDALISGLVGIACSTIILQQFGEHLDQLSATDCELLFNVCREWLAEPGPLHRVLRAEWRIGREALSHLAKQLELPTDPPGGRPDEGTPEERLPRDFAEMARRRTAFLTELERAGHLYDDYFARLLQQLGRPAWERSLPDMGADDSASARLVETLSVPVQRTLDSYTRERALVQLLACHAAIRRYHWEFGRLPASLGELRLGDLAVDPFTGQPLHYVGRGREYDLSSVGPQVGEDNPNAVNGRLPVVLGR